MMKRIILVLLICFSFVIGFSQKIVEVFPRSGGLLSGVSVTITGLNTHFASGTGTSVVFKQGSNTIHGNINASGPNFMHFTSVGNIPDVGFYDLYAQNSLDGYLYKQNAIFIQSYNSAKLLKVIPDSVIAGNNFNVTITGQNTHFASGTGTTAYFVQGTKTIQLTNYSSPQNNSIFVNSFAPQNARGFYDLVTYNIIDGYKYLDYSMNFFNVNSPFVVSMSIDTLRNWTLGTQQLVINFQNTHFTLGQNIVYNPLQSYMVIDSFTVLSNTKLLIYFRIPIIGKGYITSGLLSIANQMDGLIQKRLVFDLSLGFDNSVNSFKEIRISPNPFTDIVSFQTEEFLNENLNIDVYSCLGIKLKELKISNQKEISLDLSGFSSGIYYVNFRNEEKSKLVKIIKK